MDAVIYQLTIITVWLTRIVFYAVAAAGVWGAVEVIMTRDDAFEADNRMPKWNWFLILAGGTFCLVISLPMIWLFGAVAIGVYWMDVRPSIKDLLAGNRNAW